MPSTKVFIYNVNTGPNSQADLKELFTAYNIFNKPDITECNFELNLTGLDATSNPTFVVPGGQALNMTKLKPCMELISKHLDGQGYNFVGVCAGGIVATAESHIFSTNYQYVAQSKALQAPQYFSHGSKMAAQLKINFGLVTEYTSIGCFYPNNTYDQCQVISLEQSQLIPHRVQLKLSGSTVLLPQLYVKGPGFFPNNPADQKQGDMVVATYADSPYYDFDYDYPNVDDEKDNTTKGKAKGAVAATAAAAPSTTTKRISNLPAMICRKPKQENCGGVVLSGTHFETCVRESKLLKFFGTKDSAKKRITLSAAETTAFIDEQKNSEAVVVKLLKENLRPG